MRKNHGQDSVSRTVACRISNHHRIDHHRVDAGHCCNAHRRQGGAERGPDHSGQRRRQARHLQETRTRPDDRRLHRRQQDDAGDGGRQYRYWGRCGHRDGVRCQGCTHDCDLRDRRAPLIPQYRCAVGLPDPLARPAQRQEDRRIYLRLVDRLAGEGPCAQKGMGTTSHHCVTMGNAPTTIIAAFREHLVDAYVNVTSLFLTMEENKTGRVLAPVSQYEGKLAVGTLYASKRLIDTDPHTVRAFVAGWIEMIDFILTHKAETVKIESEITGFSESVMSRDYDLTIGMFTKDCKFDSESLATLKRSFVDLKLLATPPDMSALYTEAFLPK